MKSATASESNAAHALRPVATLGAGLHVISAAAARSTQAAWGQR